MKWRNLAVVAICIGCLAVTERARAALTTLTFDELNLYTNLEIENPYGVTEGVSFYTNNSHGMSVVSLLIPPDNYMSPNKSVCGVDIFPHVFSATFWWELTHLYGAPVDTVSVDMRPFFVNFGDSNTFSLSVFDAGHNLLASTSLNVPSTYDQFVTLSLTGHPGITYAEWTSGIHVGASADVFPGSVYWDNFTFGTAESQPVPEPSTMLLLGGGLAGLVALRRKRNPHRTA